MTKPTLGTVIKNYRKEHGLSMQDFAELSGLTKGYISRLESNKGYGHDRAPVPSINTYKNVAQAMRITLDELIRMVDGSQVVSLVETSDDEKLLKCYEQIADILGLDVNDVAMAISFVKEMKQKNDN